MSNAYDPKEVEQKIYALWEKNKFFHAKTGTDKKKYSVVIPPPNVTGILHMGHALNNTIQDILVRYKRMQGFEVLWMPGTDHAGIATQNVVEKKLKAEKKRKEDLGREKFIENVWQWKEKYGSTIINQLKRLGCSCDWDRERFTMDEGLSNAVKEVFVDLYNRDLIYRGTYIINWCPRCRTALSDEEAEHMDIDGAFYHIKYPIIRKNQQGNPTKDDYVVVATTRPETMLGDVAICVNPKDKRYKHLKDAQEVTLPILNRKLKIIFDEEVDVEVGTGVLKVTPAHDPVDFELGKKYGLEEINVMNEDATINAIGGEFEGMDRFEAREAIINKLKQMGLFVKSEVHRHAVGHCYRCNTMVEPRLSPQWFVKMKPLAVPAIKAVEKDEINFYPKRWEKVYLNWMNNIRDWCISRQIWWGHRIPVYYCQNCYDDKDLTDNRRGVIVSKTKPEKCPECKGTDIKQEEDVLDTWFSSWLWPFSTMGWPQKTKELHEFYPTSMLATAQDIIFFWVARMIMAGYAFMGKAPFKDIYIHGIVRDDKGRKMSKSIGNIIDPLDIIDKFGTDALRFSIISITAQGQDIFLSEKKFEVGRNFANKLWNASRFVKMNLKEDVIGVSLEDLVKCGKLNSADRWIISRFYKTADEVSKYLETYKLNDAANRIYEFVWHEFCDWYLEMSKLTIEQKNTQVVLYNILEMSLRIMHPIMPFISEEIWQGLPKEEDAKISIMVSLWPKSKKKMKDTVIDKKMALIIEIIQTVRNIRANWKIEPVKFIDIAIKVTQDEEVDMIRDNQIYIKRLARVENITVSTTVEKPEHAGVAVIGDLELFVPLKGVIDIDREKLRLNDLIDELKKKLNLVSDRLEKGDFVNKAPEKIVNMEKERKNVLETEISGLEKNLAQL
ncbi:MAG: valine--tRNA ligase [Candidatus Omnitrophica bacterium]|nr:valine--tRNA ligase [Candidatus Omnitrophota bacterium]